MTLYIKGMNSPDDLLFYIYDQNSEPLWYVRMPDNTPSKLRIISPEGDELLSIIPAIVALNPKYHISIGGIERVRVVYKSGFGCNPVLTGAGGWSLLGEACTGYYSVINRNEEVIFKHERKWSSEGEYIELDIPVMENGLLSAGIAIAIDQTISITPKIQPV